MFDLGIIRLMQLIDNSNLDDKNKVKLLKFYCKSIELGQQNTFNQNTLNQVSKENVIEKMKQIKLKDK
jgi:hypothetical protein